MLDKEDKKQCEKFIDEGMIFADKLIWNAKTPEQRLLGQHLYNAYYCIKLIYKEV